MYRILLIVLSILVYAPSVLSITLSEGTVDYGGPTKVDRTDVSRVHSATGDYITVEASKGIIFAGTPDASEYLLKALDVGVSQRLGIKRDSIMASDATTIEIGASGTSTGNLVLNDGGAPARISLGDWSLVENDMTGVFEFGNSTGDAIIAADQVNHAAPLKFLQYDYVVEVSPDGNDTDAGNGIGPYATISAAVTAANTLAGSADRVLIYLHPGVYGSGSSYAGALQDGVSLQGSGIGTTKIRNVYFTVGNITENGTRYIGNFTVELTSPVAIGWMGSAAISSKAIFHDMKIYSSLPFEEASSGGLVTVFRNAIGDTNWTFRNVNYVGKSIFLFDGHPSLGSLDAIRNVTMENCYIEMKPDNAGPADSHFPILHYSPGKKNYRNTTIISDLSNSTNSEQTHGIVLVLGNNTNSYPSGEITEATFINCFLQIYDSGTGTNQYALQVNADADRSARMNVYNSTLLIEDDFDYEVAVSGAGTPDFLWLNTNINSENIITAGNGTYTQLSSGSGAFNDLTVSGTITGGLTIDGTAAITFDSGSNYLPIATMVDASGNKKQVIYSGTCSSGTVDFSDDGFPLDFSAAPIVVITPIINAGGSSIFFGGWIKTITTTGFTYAVRELIIDDKEMIYECTDVTEAVSVRWTATGYID